MTETTKRMEIPPIRKNTNILCKHKENIYILLLCEKYCKSIILTYNYKEIVQNGEHVKENSQRKRKCR